MAQDSSMGEAVKQIFRDADLKRTGSIKCSDLEKVLISIGGEQLIQALGFYVERWSQSQELLPYDDFIDWVFGCQGEEAVADMLDEWSKVELSLISYRDLCPILSGGVDMFALLQDQIKRTDELHHMESQSQASKASLISWNAKLLNMQQVLCVWCDVQRVWLYLERIFAGHAVNEWMPVEAQNFKQVNTLWHQIMNSACNSASAFSVLNHDWYLHNLKFARDLLDSVMTGVENHIEHLRREELPVLRLLSNEQAFVFLATSSPMDLEFTNLSSTLFGFVHLHVNEGSGEVAALSDVDVGVLELSPPVSTNGRFVVQYTKELLVRISQCFQKRTVEMYTNMQAKPPSVLALAGTNAPLQVIACALQAHFTCLMDEAIPMFVVSLQIAPEDSGCASLKATSMNGDEIGTFRLDDAKMCIATVRSALSGLLQVPVSKVGLVGPAQNVLDPAEDSTYVAEALDFTMSSDVIGTAHHGHTVQAAVTPQCLRERREHTRGDFPKGWSIEGVHELVERRMRAETREVSSFVRQNYDAQSHRISYLLAIFLEQLECLSHVCNGAHDTSEAWKRWQGCWRFYIGSDSEPCLTIRCKDLEIHHSAALDSQRFRFPFHPVAREIGDAVISAMGGKGDGLLFVHGPSSGKIETLFQLAHDLGRRRMIMDGRDTDTAFGSFMPGLLMIFEDFDELEADQAEDVIKRARQELPGSGGAAILCCSEESPSVSSEAISDAGHVHMKSVFDGGISGGLTASLVRQGFSEFHDLAPAVHHLFEDGCSSDIIRKRYRKVTQAIAQAGTALRSLSPEAQDRTAEFTALHDALKRHCADFKCLGPTLSQLADGASQA